MPSFNQITLVGHLTRDVQLKNTASGSTVADVGIAVNEYYKGKEKAMFVDLVLWNEKAETFAQYVKKGDPVLVSGKLQLDQWETSDGQRRSKHKVNVFTFQFLKGRDANQAQDDNYENAPEQSREDVVSDNDLPF